MEPVYIFGMVIIIFFFLCVMGIAMYNVLNYFEKRN
jgi:hypothetical protein